jgi:hypothetical protein
MAIDPHQKYYPFIKWYAVTPLGCVVQYNEWPKFEDLGMWYDEARESRAFGMSPRELANIILANDMSLQYGAQIMGRVPDPRFDAQNPAFVRQQQECGVLGWVQAEHEKVETQRERLKRLMEYNPALPRLGMNMPQWYVRKGCRNSNRAYLRLMWDEDKEKEMEEGKDPVDCDRYFLNILGDPIRYVPVIKRGSLMDGGGQQVAGYMDHQREMFYANTMAMGG